MRPRRLRVLRSLPSCLAALLLLAQQTAAADPDRAVDADGPVPPPRLRGSKEKFLYGWKEEFEATPESFKKGAAGRHQASSKSDIGFTQPMTTERRESLLQKTPAQLVKLIEKFETRARVRIEALKGESAKGWDRLKEVRESIKKYKLESAKIHQQEKQMLKRRVKEVQEDAARQHKQDSEQIRAKEAEIHNNKKKIMDGEELIKKKETSIQKHTVRIEEIRKLVREKEALILKKQAEVGTKDGHIEKQTRELQEYKRQIVSREQRIREHERSLQQTQEQVSDAKLHIRKQESEAEKYKRTIETVSDRQALMADTLDAMEKLTMVGSGKDMFQRTTAALKTILKEGDGYIASKWRHKSGRHDGGRGGH